MSDASFWTRVSVLRDVRAVLGITLLTLGCNKAHEKPSAPPVPARPASAAPASDGLAHAPPPGQPHLAPFPSIVRRSLANGLAVLVVSRREYPIVALRLIVLAGSASDGDDPGAALVCGELLKAGGAGRWDARALLERAASLGTDLGVVTRLDATTIGLGVTSSHTSDALDLLAAVASRPRLAPQEFEKLKRREIERTQTLSRASASWAASMALYDTLYRAQRGTHPYARHDVQPAQIRELTLADCRQWHRRNVVPPNAALIAVGDIDPEALTTDAARAFASWSGSAPPELEFPELAPRGRLDVWVVDRPGSEQSLVQVGLLGPERNTPEWAALTASNQVLGGGVASRLFSDLREQESLAYSVGSTLGEVAHARVPIVLAGGTRTSRTDALVAGLLGHLEGLSTSPPTSRELRIATRYLSDTFLLQLETLGGVAELTGNLTVLGLPEDYYDTYRRRLIDLGVAAVEPVAARYFGENTATVVVAGDARAVADSLTRFGPVTVLDPQHGFATERSLPATSR